MEVIIIAAVCKNSGLGYQGKIPWRLTSDLIRFREITMGYPIIMGRKTFESLPDGPLEGRKNIVLSRSKKEQDGVVFVETISKAISECQGVSKVFVIGGAEVYSAFLASGLVNKIMITQIEKLYDCDAFFPVFSAYRYQLVEWSEKHYSAKEQCYFQYLTYDEYKRIPSSQNELSYLKMVQDIFDNGKERDDRTGTGTIAVFGSQMRFNLGNYSLPLLTTKFVGWRTVLKELLWFLRGETDSKILEKQGVNIWKGNTSREFLDSRGLNNYVEGDVGPMYFFQVFHYGAEYKGCDAKYDGCGFDQMKVLLDGLQKDPYSRRHMLTTYNPADVDKSVLAPCHGIVIQFYVQDDSLSCHMYQRSQDTFLGSPFNIASYAMLTHIIAAKVGMKANELIISTGDTHIYKNHIDQMKKQLTRVPYPSPKFIMSDKIKEKDFSEMTVEDFDVVGYFHHPQIRGEMAI